MIRIPDEAKNYVILLAKIIKKRFLSSQLYIERNCLDVSEIEFITHTRLHLYLTVNQGNL